MKRYSTVAQWSETFNKITNVEVCVVTCSRARKQRAAYNFRVIVQEMSAAFYRHNIVKIRFMTNKYADTY